MSEERRSISLTKEDAIKFYNSDNEALKGIALMAFNRLSLMEIAKICMKYFQKTQT